MRRPSHRPRPLAAMLCLLASLTATSAWAFDPPPLKNHVADPGHFLSDHDRSDLSDKLKHLQQDTAIEVDLLVADLPDEEIDAAGEAAFQKWKVGSSSDNGVLIVLSRSVARIVQLHGPPILHKKDVAGLLGARKRDKSIADNGIEIVKATEKLLKAKALHHRPRGVSHPDRGVFFLAGFVSLLALAILLTVQARTREQSAPAPVP